MMILMWNDGPKAADVETNEARRRRAQALHAAIRRSAEGRPWAKRHGDVFGLDTKGYSVSFYDRCAAAM